MTFITLIGLPAILRIPASIVQAESNLMPSISETSYRFVLNHWVESGLIAPSMTQRFGVGSMTSSAASVQHQTREAIRLHKGDSVSIVVEVDQTGLYEIWLDYSVVGDRSSNPLIRKTVSFQDVQTVQYNEDGMLRLPLVFVNSLSAPTLDRYGDEIPIRPQIDSDWSIDTKLFDPAGIVKSPLKNRLEAGLNTITFTLLNTVDLYLGAIVVTNSSPLSSYAEYLSSWRDQGAVEPAGRLITVLAENYQAKGSTTVTAYSIASPHMSNYVFNQKKLNAVNVRKADQWVEYAFDVAEAGLYQIAIKAEMPNRGMSIYRKISINGSVPFAEFNHLELAYEKDWSNHVLKQNNAPYLVYFPSGTNTLRIETSPGMTEYVDRIQSVILQIQELSMEITSLTGGQNDINRTWKMAEYIPDISVRLSDMADQVQAVYELMMSRSSERPAQFNSLRLAANQLRKLAAKPDLVIEKAYWLNQGSSSAANILSSALTNLAEEPLVMDKLFVYSNATLPKPNVSFFRSLWEGIKSFVYSFFDPRYDVALSKDPETVRVWVKKSKLQVDIMQRMADELFTAQTGIDVELIVLQDENRLVLANAAGDTPDVALSIGGGGVFDYALRGMLADLSQFSEFQTAATGFHPQSFVPYLFDTGVYAMPETQDVALLFYRTDILGSLGLSAPNTWDDVLRMLPLLQSLGMNYYHPLSGSAATKSINHMSPVIYQRGGEFYGETADQILIRSAQTSTAVKFMIDLYNIYNLPLQVGSFYQSFRNGTLPIGIGDQNMYIQLKYSAPELIGQWGVLPIPGEPNDQGEIERWDTALGSAAILFKQSKNLEQAWKFIQWWTSAEVQAEFSYELTTNLGDMFLYMSANLDGFRHSSWPEDSKDAILAQWEWIRIPPRLPGYYMLERELSNVFNKAVFSQTNYRFALDEAYFNLQREILRKLKEFNYDENRKYLIPSNANLDEWIGE
jgi:ABC-type glycerol-3-phosphate transport system substrate-binding protein